MSTRKERGVKGLNLDLPSDLHDFYSKLCITLGITRTEGVIQYIRYLRAQQSHKRKGLNEDSNFDDFEPNGDVV
jgi:hypothetical protein